MFKKSLIIIMCRGGAWNPMPREGRGREAGEQRPSSFLIGAIKGKYRRVTGSQGFIVILPFYYADKKQKISRGIGIM